MTNIYTKIQKLRRLQQSPYPEEAEAAKRKADALVAKYGNGLEYTEDWQQELYSYIELFGMGDNGFDFITEMIEFCLKYGKPNNEFYTYGYKIGVKTALACHYDRSMLDNANELGMMTFGDEDAESAKFEGEAVGEDVAYDRLDGITIDEEYIKKNLWDIVEF